MDEIPAKSSRLSGASPGSPPEYLSGAGLSWCDAGMAFRFFHCMVVMEIVKEKKVSTVTVVRQN
ncbi:hypothetical protein ASZ90_014949 [hydrocarbon metagenome]|uniref:Uncharacterized protein n=1 Tax=hydrocarbon metagenome TaxID=938273 RepID=A0A0W8F3A7_9ZZZZ